MSAPPDLLVLGGGVAGCVAAICARRMGLDVAMLSLGRPGHSPGEGLSPRGLGLLRQLGLQRHAEAHGREWVGVTSAWSSLDVVDDDFLMRPAGPGRHLNRAAFDRSLLEVARDALGARCIEAERTLVTSSDPWEVRWSEGGRWSGLRPRFVIDATGRARLAARAAGAAIIAADRLIAWHGELDLAPNAPMRLMVSAAPGGWWYACPLPGGRASLCFLTDPDLCRKRRLPEILLEDGPLRLAGALRFDLAGWRPRPYPAGASALDAAGGRCWLAVGDAALAHDPLSGQGIEFAIASACRAAVAAARSLAGDPLPGREYENLVTRRWSASLHARRAVYAQADRWRGAPFWSRRSGGPTRPGREMTHARSAA